MKKLRTLLAACTLGLALTACGSSSAPLAPEGARLDGGYGYGSGNFSDSTSTTTTTNDSTVTARGGYTLGSGN